MQPRTGNTSRWWSISVGSLSLIGIPPPLLILLSGKIKSNFSPSVFQVSPPPRVPCPLVIYPRPFRSPPRLLARVESWPRGRSYVWSWKMRMWALRSWRAAPPPPPHSHSDYWYCPLRWSSNPARRTGVWSCWSPGGPVSPRRMKVQLSRPARNSKNNTRMKGFQCPPLVPRVDTKPTMKACYTNLATILKPVQAYLSKEANSITNAKYLMIGFLKGRAMMPLWTWSTFQCAKI